MLISIDRLKPDSTPVRRRQWDADDAALRASIAELGNMFFTIDNALVGIARSAVEIEPSADLSVSANERRLPTPSGGRTRMSKGGHPPKSYGRDSGRGFNPRSSAGLNLQHSPATVCLRTPVAMSEPEPRAHAPRLPNFFATPAPDAPPHPDAELLDLAEQVLSEAKATRHLRGHMDDLGRRFPLHRHATEAERAPFDRAIEYWDDARRSTAKLIRRAGWLKATTPAGLAAKALICRASKTGSPKLAVSLAEDLLDNPHLRRAVWPATIEEA